MRSQGILVLARIREVGEFDNVDAAGTFRVGCERSKKKGEVTLNMGQKKIPLKKPLGDLSSSSVSKLGARLE